MRILFITLTMLSAMVIFLVAGCASNAAPAAKPSASSTATTAAPVKLAFVTQPGGAAAGSPFSSQPAVALQDANGNTVTTSRLVVNIALTSGTGTDGATLYGPTTLFTTNGIAKFNTLYINKAGTNYTLTATSGALASAVSLPFNISSRRTGEAGLRRPAVRGVAGTPFTTQPEIAVLDHFGNPVSGYQGSVTMAISYGGVTGAVISGNTTVPVSNNTARFTDLSIDKAFPQFTITVMSGSLEPATSISFEVTAGTPVKLEFTVPPDGAKAGKPFDTQPKVAIEDKYGNVVITAKDPVTLTLTPGTGTSGAVLTGAQKLITEDGLGGLAEFTDLSIDKAGSGYTLTATSDKYTAAVSPPFDVSP